VVISGIPGLAPVAPADGVEHTRMAPPRPPKSHPQWELEFDGGRVVALTESLILGRDPAAEPDESAALLALGDDGRSVSKTHLRIDPSPGGVQVTDRHSTNGVIVVTAGVRLHCVPGVPTVVPDGSTVQFGDRQFELRSR
jgi:hypothetical protein